MEVAARALIPALRDAAPGAALHRVRQPRGGGRGPRRRVGRRARRGHEPRRVGARRAAAAAGPGAARRAATSSTRSARPRPARGRFARVTTIHDLNYLMVPDAHFGLRGLGMRVLVPLAARTVAPRDRRLRVDARRPRRAAAACRRRRIDVVPLGLGRPAAAAPTPAAELRARARPRRPAGRALPVGQAPAQEPARAARRARADRPPSAGRCSCSPATRRRTRPSCARTRPRSGVADDVRFLGWTSRGGRRGAVRARPPRSCSRRSTRASACRCSRRWRAACRSRARTARRCPRWPATPRCCSIRTIPARSPRRSSGCSATAPRPTGCARPGARRRRASPGRGRRS